MADETDVHTLTGAYALDALDDVERARVERHLQECEDCAAEVRSFHETAARLGAGAAVLPSAGLRDRVLGEIAVTRQLPQTSSRRETSHRAATRTTRWLAVAASSLLVLSLGLGAFAWSEYTQANEAQQVAAGMSEILSDPQRQVTDADFGSGHGTIVVSGDRVILPRPSALVQATGDGDYWAAADGVRPGDEFGVTIERAGGAQTPSDDLVLITA
jgi:anti-sigma-K factor RskA